MRKRFLELNDKPDASLTPEEKTELANIRTSFRSQRQQSLRADLTSDLRHAMRQETESVFDYILREDRSLLELLDSNYTFVNERLARHYGLTNVALAVTCGAVTLLPRTVRAAAFLTEGTRC